MITLQNLLDELARLEMSFTEKQVLLQFKSGKFSPEIETVLKSMLERNKAKSSKSPSAEQLPFEPRVKPAKWRIPRSELEQMALEFLSVQPYKLRDLSDELELDDQLTRELMDILRKQGKVANRRHGETDRLVWCLVDDPRTRPKYGKRNSPRDKAFQLKEKTFFGVPCGNCGSTLRYTICRACVPCSKARVEVTRDRLRGKQS